MTLQTVSLTDKYLLDSGYAFMTGIQALVRLPLAQRQRDEQHGQRTAGYISGYRGSPLGAYDQQLFKAADLLRAQDIVFQPGVNEDLAATACWGTQQAGLDGEGRHDGVFAIWYGKGPGVDRSGDALRHANLAGTAALGGVLALLGDDHICESSTTAHQSEYAMVDAMIPVLNPATVQEILDYGLIGIALSRYSGCWVALKCVHDTVEASAVVRVDNTVDIHWPEDHSLPSHGLNIRWPDTPLQQEARLHDHKLDAVRAFVRANGLDQTQWRTTTSRLGIVTTGKAYLDVLQALQDLGIDSAERATELGIAIYKVAMPWPLEPTGLRAFASGLDLLMVVEEKRSLMEAQVKEQLYRQPNAPQVIGKYDEDGKRLFPTAGRLDPNHIAHAIGDRLLQYHDDPDLGWHTAERASLMTGGQQASPALTRTPYFCAGCPHNTSTQVPAGSKALAGIGCHYMAQWMDRDTARYTQMGAEGASWVGTAPFSTREHMFQNMGDGTYFHSGLLAIRAAVAARTPITFKILYNDAVAMTGGQGMDGPLDPAMITRQVHAEGVAQVMLVSDQPEKFTSATTLAPGTSVHHRDELDAVQRQLREIPGVTVLVYDQTCAAEKRRRRKRNQYPDPPKRVFINERVCEGCGDCGVKSNCVAVVPKTTDYGRKREIDQSACNKDYSCLKGFCPSFVTVHGGELRRGRSGVAEPELAPEPALAAIDHAYGIVVTGVGGTGVVTLGALLGMAAHLEGKGVTVLDMLGLAQKGGAVMSHIRITPTPAQSTTSRVSSGGAQLLLGGDLVVSASPEAITTLSADSMAVVNSREMMTGDFTRHADLSFPAEGLRRPIDRAAGTVDYIDAVDLATQLLGDAIYANPLLLGYAYQKGWLPVSAAALEEAMRLNGVAVAANQRAFRWGRQAALDPAAIQTLSHGEDQPTFDDSVEALVNRRAADLEDYQNAAYAAGYRQRIAQVQARETALVDDDRLSRTVARYYYKLLAYKDEYEVARLHSDPAFQERLAARFQGDYRLEFHLAPPLLSRPDPDTGEIPKRRFGGWMLRVFSVLARLRGLRGTPLDPFGYTAERRQERQLISDYEAILDELLANLSPENHDLAVAIAAIPEQIRGYGPVKKRHLDEARTQEAALLAAFRSGERSSAAA